MNCRHLWDTDPLANPDNVIQGKNFRFTLLTDSLIRMEYSEDGIFEDRPTQVVWNRRFPAVSYQLTEKGSGFELSTGQLRLIYDGGVFSRNGLMVKALGGLSPYGCEWHYGEGMGNERSRGNLKGTARTLDEVNGACGLEDGILDCRGCAVLDDSRSLVLMEKPPRCAKDTEVRSESLGEWIEPRKSGVTDIYLFAYGTRYKEALHAFYRLTGKVQMLPRYALGNWWSRFYRYSEDSYKELITRFEEEKTPFTVAVIDMDWHLVEDVDPKYGSPWTGFTWNRKLFPDPPRFLAWLHEHGLKTTLNLHPADGIRAYEEAYPRMAEALGMEGTPIEFDVASPDFLNAYFECVLHPMEEEGVDFWWIDWQQGNTTRIPGLDPLWMLNHFHYLDNARDGKRPMTFSRYAGPGSHRYPVGFSGDTITTWESLDFQPFFTSTASNIGFGWWSHDIGGHMLGYRDFDMAARWVQLGVFSPIMRLHSSNSEFNRKEPWSFPTEICNVMEEFLRLRHRLLPYLYTMNHRAYQEDQPLISPMYYEYPEEPAAYQVKNQYLFGDALLAAPITTPQITGLNRGKVKVWLPDGLYIDFFTGVLYGAEKSASRAENAAHLPDAAES